MLSGWTEAGRIINRSLEALYVLGITDLEACEAIADFLHDEGLEDGSLRRGSIVAKIKRRAARMSKIPLPSTNRGKSQARATDNIPPEKFNLSALEY